ncbi:MAG TPA: hypothetical protein VGL94_01540 [Ktedonobacteraceae bacterium]|jgi:hypothetical protein
MRALPQLSSLSPQNVSYVPRKNFSHEVCLKQDPKEPDKHYALEFIVDLERISAMMSNLTSKRLHLSMLWFAMITIILSPIYASYQWRNNWGTPAIVWVSAIILSSPLCWWLCIVRPKRVSILSGVLAGIVTVVMTTCVQAVYGTWMFIWQPNLIEILIMNNWSTLPLLLSAAIGLLLVILQFLLTSLILSPMGWISLLLWGGAGGWLAWYLRRPVFPKANINQHTPKP